MKENLMRARISVAFRLQAGVRYDDEAAVHVSWCPALGIYSQGNTQTEAQRAIRGAIELYLRHCYQRKILDDLLNQAGFEPCEDGDLSDDDQFIDVTEYPHTFTVDVPIELLQNAKAGGPDRSCPPS